MSGAVAATPRLYPLQLEGGRVGLLDLSEDDYRAASFLDARLLGSDVALQWREFEAFTQAQRPAAVRAHFIFHIGHVGSTLLSRLVGEHPVLFSVREPALLRVAAVRAAGADLATLLMLYSRVWRPEQTAVIKATSFVSALAPELMATGGGSAILLSATPPAYLRAILGGPASRQEAQALLPSRRERLSRRLGVAVEAASEGEAIALSWLCETLSLHDLARLEPQRTLWLDFDRLLAEPRAALRLAFSHLGVDTTAFDIDSLVSGPLMRRYSKAPEHAYDADLRRQVLEQAGREQAVEVARGMDWLQRMHTALPDVAPVLRRAADAARASLAASPAAV